MTLLECIERHHAAEAQRQPGQPIRIIHVACLPPAGWRHLGAKFCTLGVWLFQQARCKALVETGEHLGLDAVGLVIERRTEATP